jgi:hypothetical protein
MGPLYDGPNTIFTCYNEHGRDFTHKPIVHANYRALRPNGTLNKLLRKLLPSSGVIATQTTVYFPWKPCNHHTQETHSQLRRLPKRHIYMADSI